MHVKQCINSHLGGLQWELESGKGHDVLFEQPLAVILPNLLAGHVGSNGQNPTLGLQTLLELALCLTVMGASLQQPR